MRVISSSSSPQKTSGFVNGIVFAIVFAAKDAPAIINGALKADSKMPRGGKCAQILYECIALTAFDVD